MLDHKPPKIYQLLVLVVVKQSVNNVVVEQRLFPHIKVM